MSIDLNTRDDGLPVRSSGSWALAKLDYLARYMDAFVNAVSDKPWRAMHYLDLFAGPGKCRVRQSGEVHLGSPLIALKARPAFARY